MAKTAKTTPKYVDGFLLPVPKKNLDKYRAMARKAGKIWIEYGALQFVESAGDDLKIEGMTGFPDIIKIKPDETIMFSFITYKSKAHRNSVNKKVMSDPRLNASMEMPFDMKKMAMGGFKSIVSL